MNNRTEDNFRETLKTLVIEEPQKLAFFDGLDADSAIPPFVPTDTERNGEDNRKKYSGRRKRHMFSMLAAAACSLVLVCMAAVNYSPDSMIMMNADHSAAAPAAAEVAESDDSDAAAKQQTDAGGYADEEIEAAPAPAMLEAGTIHENANPTFIAFVIGAVIFAAAFLILFLQYRKSRI